MGDTTLARVQRRTLTSIVMGTFSSSDWIYTSETTLRLEGSSEWHQTFTITPNICGRFQSLGCRFSSVATVYKCVTTRVQVCDMHLTACTEPSTLNGALSTCVRVCDAVHVYCSPGGKVSVSVFVSAQLSLR